MSNRTIFAKPWFVASVVFGCFAILTPKILIPLVRQLFGIVLNQEQTVHEEPAIQQQQQARQHRFNPLDRGPSKPGMGGNADGGGGSTGKTVLGFLLPLYAIGIAGYMVYTLCKIYGGKTKTTEEENAEQLLNEIKYTNIKWDPIKNEFINQYVDLKDDNLDEYASSLDQDYVEFLRQKRQNKDTNGNNMKYILSTMKESLNNINSKLKDAETNLDLANAFNETYIDGLKMQLANTELQMTRLLGLINSEDQQRLLNLSENEQSDEDDGEANENGHKDDGDDDADSSSIVTTTTQPSRSPSTSSLNESSNEKNTQRTNFKIKKHSKKEYANKVYKKNTIDSSEEDDDEVEHVVEDSSEMIIEKAQHDNANDNNSPLELTSEE